MAAIHALISAMASWSAVLRPISGIIVPGSVEVSRYGMIEASGWPGTMSKKWLPVPWPAAVGGLQMPSS